MVDELGQNKCANMRFHIEIMMYILCVIVCVCQRFLDNLENKMIIMYMVAQRLLELTVQFHLNGPSLSHASGNVNCGCAYVWPA